MSIIPNIELICETFNRTHYKNLFKITRTQAEKNKRKSASLFAAGHFFPAVCKAFHFFETQLMVMS